MTNGETKIRHYRRFDCSRCGYKFIHLLASSVAKCHKCSLALIEVGKSFKFLNDYEQMKYHWYKYPLSHLDNIKHRKVQTIPGGSQKVFLTDDRGYKLGEMPSAENI